MKKTLSLWATLAITCLSANVSWGQGKAIIDTDFSQADAAGVPLCRKEVTVDAEFPLKLMTGTRETISVEPPSSVVSSREEKNGMKPPFALVTIKLKAEENAKKKNDGPFASAGLIWKFQDVPLGAGKYGATWSFVPLTQVRKLRMAFTLMGEKPDGKLEKIEPGVESNEIPLQIMVMGGKIIAGKETVPLREDKPNEVTMDFDLSKNTWGLELNGKKMVRTQSFPEGYLAQFKKFWVVSLGMGGGGVEESGGAQYAVGPVKLTKLN